MSVTSTSHWRMRSPLGLPKKPAAGTRRHHGAPPRDLVAQLNRRARDHRLDGHSQPLRGAAEADGQSGERRRCDHHPHATTDGSDSPPPTGSRTATGGPSPASAERRLTVRHNRSRLPSDCPPTMSARRPVSATPPPSIRPKASPPTPCTDSHRAGIPTAAVHHAHPRPGGNHLYLQVVGDGDPHTVIRPDTIAPRAPTETLAADPRPRRSPSPPHAAARTQRPGGPATHAVQPYADGLHVAAEQLVGPKPSQSSTKPTRSSPPNSPADPPCRPRAHLLGLAAETDEHPLRHLLTAASGRDLEPPVTWPPSSTGASQRSPLPTQVRCPGSPAYQKRCRPIQSGGPTLPSRSRLVADLADQVQDHACQADVEAVATFRKTTPNATLSGEIAVGGPANGINPQDPRPTGGTQLETLPALWKTTPRPGHHPFHLPASRGKSRPPAGSTHHRLRPRDDRQRPYQKPERRPNGPSAHRR